MQSRIYALGRMQMDLMLGMISTKSVSGLTSVQKASDDVFASNERLQKVQAQCLAW